jgi:hypothetical protein
MSGRFGISLLAAWILGLPGCGYQFQGATTPEGATIEIPVFENRTVETGIEAILTDRVIAEFRRTPGWTVAPPGEGRYVLKGIVIKFVSDPHLVTTQRIAAENRAYLVLDVRFRERSSGKDLWREPGLRTFADYPLAGQVLVSERSKQTAITSIADELATRIRVRVQDTW